MKKVLILIFTFSPIILFGQHLKCCKSKKEVKNYLSGVWKENNSNSKTVYKYWFEKRKGNLTEMEQDENTDNYLIINDHTFVDIKKFKKGFKLSFTNLHESWFSELKHLGSDKMVIVTNEKVVEYHKVDLK